MKSEGNPVINEKKPVMKVETGSPNGDASSGFPISSSITLLDLLSSLVYGIHWPLCPCITAANKLCEMFQTT